jgi:hypothetical protein
MTRSDSVTSYLMKVTQICDQLATVGEKVADAELVNMALNGFLASWEPFVKGICACENLPNFERLWDDCIQEETRMESKASKKGGDENLTYLVRQIRVEVKDPTRVRERVRSQPHNQEKDLSKIKCFIFHKHGHYASQCPDKKGKGKSSLCRNSDE